MSVQCLGCFERGLLGNVTTSQRRSPALACRPHVVRASVTSGAGVSDESQASTSKGAVQKIQEVTTEIASNVVGLPKGMVPSTSFTQMSTHPDAMKRRMAAEKRRLVRWEELKKPSASDDNGWWETDDAPDNCVAVSSEEDFYRALQLAPSKTLVVAQFFAPHCNACRTLHPKMKQLAQQNSNVIFLQVNGAVDKAFDLCKQLGVENLPWFHFYKNGKLVTSFSANLTRINIIRAELAANKGDTPAWPFNQR